MSVETFEIVWKNHLIFERKKTYEISKFILSNMEGLMPLYSREKKRLIAYAEENGIYQNIMISLRNQLRSQKEKDMVVKFESFVDSIKDRFINGFIPRLGKETDIRTNVLNFYSSFKIPPHFIFKTIKDLPEFIALDETTRNSLERPVKDQTKMEMETKANANKYETDFALWLKKVNIIEGKNFSTEKTIKEKKLHKLTPDFLFETPIIISLDDKKHNIHWIDVKNYFLGDIQLITDKLKEQSKKYNETFGNGAFVFHYGLTSGIIIPNTLILDGSFIRYYEETIDDNMTQQSRVYID